MTDQTAPGVPDDDRRLAREWAESIKSATNSGEPTTNPWSDRALAAARVLLAVLPTPPHPTLADMTDEERAACKRMQADVADYDTRYTILDPSDKDGEVALLAPDWEIKWIFPEYVTPRPDLPRLEWPGTENPAPALPGDWRLADHYRIGRVIVTNPTPNPGGHVYFVTSDETVPRGSGWGFCTPNELTYLDEEPDQ